MNFNRNVAIITTLTIAMLGATIIASSSLTQVVQAKSSTTGTELSWCYNTPQGRPCFENHGECTKFMQQDEEVQSGCFKQRELP